MPQAASTPTVLACGAWLKNAACLLEGGVAQMSAVHGDLGEARACAALEASLRALAAQARGPITAVAHDLHPNFFSTRIAQTLAAEWGVPAIAVQHHHAHIAAVLATHGARQPVIGLALDGYGLGDDGGAWGGELLHLSAGGGRCQRLGSLWPLGLPGGDAAAREPWRMAAAVLHALGRGAEIAPRFGAQVGEALARGVAQMLERELRCPPTSSAGRWFDAAAAALGLHLRQAHEAQAAMALEAAAALWLDAAAAPAALPLAAVQPGNRLDLRPLLAGLLDGRFAASAQPVAEAAAWFHLSLAHGLADWAAQAARQSGVTTVCLGGGCFFNRVLLQHLVARLQAQGLQVLLSEPGGFGDAGLALGQAWAAAATLPVRREPRTEHDQHQATPCA